MACTLAAALTSTTAGARRGSSGSMRRRARGLRAAAVGVRGRGDIVEDLTATGLECGRRVRSAGASARDGNGRDGGEDGIDGKGRSVGQGGQPKTWKAEGAERPRPVRPGFELPRRGRVGGREARR